MTTFSFSLTHTPHTLALSEMPNHSFFPEAIGAVSVSPQQEAGVECPGRSGMSHSSRKCSWTSKKEKQRNERERTRDGLGEGKKKREESVSSQTFKTQASSHYVSDPERLQLAVIFTD